MNADHKQAKALFLEALEKHAPDQWAAFLDEVCGGQPDLRRRVAVLLEAHRAAGTAPDQDGGEAPAPSDVSGVIGPYKLLQQIGEGGMGTVWMAQQTQPVKRLVALKVIKPGMDSRQVIARFEAERQALALMDHPNIARVLDAGTTAAGRPYFVMELVKGVPITHYCDEYRLAPRQRLELLVPICQAIQHAHQKGIIHRDLKPSNVLVCLYDGKPVPKVIDFGVAKATGQQLTEHTLVTGFGAVVGTLEYMSPEQAQLNQLDIDTRSDIYSLGVLLYELLTGTTPLERKRVKESAVLDVLRFIRDEEPPTPSRRLSTTEELPSIAANRGVEPKKLSRLVRGELDWIVMKCLDKDRNRRYETANGLARDLERYLADEPVQACPPSAGYRLRKWLRRNKGLAWAAALVLFTLALGVAGSTWQAVRATLAERQTREERNAALDAKREATEKLWDSYLAHARASRWSGRPGRRFDGLEALRQAAAIRPDLRLRNEAIALLALPDMRITKDLALPADTSGISLDPAFALFARSDGQGNLSVHRVADDGEVARLPGPGTHAFYVKLSPDGRFLAAMYHGGQATPGRVWDVSARRVILLRPNVQSLEFSPDSRAVAATDSSGVHLYDLASAKEVKRIPVAAGWRGCNFHPGGRTIAIYGDDPPCVQIYDLETDKVTRTLAQPGPPVWQADGELMAQVGWDNIYVWNTRAWVQQAVLPTPDAHTGGLALSQRGDLLASMGWDGVLRLWDPMTGQDLLRHHGAVLSQFSRDDRLLAATREGEKIQIWEVAASEVCRTLYPPTKPAGGSFDADFSPDGRLLVCPWTDGVHLWDVTSGGYLAKLPTGKSGGAVFSRDRRTLFTRSDVGLLRWPVVPDPENPGRGLQIGPAERLLSLPPDAHHGNVRLLPDDRLATNVREDGHLLVLDPRNLADKIVLPGHDLNESGLAVSPDGRWLAAGTHMHFPQEELRVTDLHSKQTVTIPTSHKTTGAFSPDNQWLVTGGDECRFWEVGTWRQGRVIERAAGLGNTGPRAFSPDGSILAIAYEAPVVRLVEPRSGRELATLAAPEARRYRWLCFSPDGCRLAGVTENAVQLWDLRLIRRELTDLGLDWDLPPYPEAAPAAPAPLQVRVLAADPTGPQKQDNQGKKTAQ
jgi:serine/threonine protein kinase/WD40 repeat protein